MEHFDRVALTPEPGGEGTAIGQRGEEEERKMDWKIGSREEKKEHRRERGEGGGEDVSGTGTNTVLFYFTSN